MTATTGQSPHSIGVFLAVLTAIFVALKLLGLVTWPWLGVLAPLWVLPAVSWPVYFVCLGIAKIIER